MIRVNHSKEEVRTFLIDRIAGFLDSPTVSIDPERKLTEYGIDSADLLTLMFDVEERFALKLGPDLLLDVETIEQMAEEISLWSR
jgi:acyl carrier protein